MRGKNIEDIVWIEKCLKNALPLIVYTYRNYYKISQTDLANMLDTDQAVVSRLENGRQEPSLTMLLYISKRIPYGLNLVKLLDPRMVKIFNLISKRIPSFQKETGGQKKFQTMLNNYNSFLTDYQNYILNKNTLDYVDKNEKIAA